MTSTEGREPSGLAVAESFAAARISLPFCHKGTFMENTWASGASELLRHADSHIGLDTAFDKRIAFVSIDNSVETSIRVFLSMPESKSGIKVTRRERDEAENSFPKNLALLFKYAGNRLPGIDEGDIEHYHRIRNTLYHDGTGLSVDQQYLDAYRSISGILLQNLFGVAIAPADSQQPTLERLILNWNAIERHIRRMMDDAGIDHGHTYKWNAAMRSGVLNSDQFQKLTELRMAPTSSFILIHLMPAKLLFGYHGRNNSSTI